MIQQTAHSPANSQPASSLAVLTLLFSLGGFIMGGISLILFFMSTFTEFRFDPYKHLEVETLIITQPSESYAAKIDSRISDGIISINTTSGWKDVQVFTAAPK